MRFIEIKKKILWFRYVFLKNNHAKIGFVQSIRAIRHGFSSDFWKAYNLKDNDPGDYISEYKRILSRRINDEYLNILDNKILFTEFFGRFVEVPIIKYLINDVIYDSEYKKISMDVFFNDFKNKKYIIKPVSGAGGHGVHLIEEKNGLFIDNQKAEKHDFEMLFKKCNYSIINEYICQHDYSSSIYPMSVNTIRLITIRDPKNNEIVLPCAAHRFGNSKSGIVDNVSSGGFVTQVDVESGTIGLAKSFTDSTAIKIHPDTKAAISGVQIPRWNKVCREVIAAHQKMPYIPLIAWDIVITEDNYSVLEVNASCSLELFQIFGSLKGTPLWDFYKYYGIV